MSNPPNEESPLLEIPKPPASITDLGAEREKRELEPWRKSLIRNGAGRAEKLTANAIVPLREAPEWRGTLRYNEFNHVIELAKPPPWEATKAKDWQVRVWTDRDDILFANWLQHKKIAIGASMASEAVFAVSHDTLYHPVRVYLKALKWDGKPRLNNWLTTYLGVEATVYSEAVGIRWLVSGIARIMQPGPRCKADCVLILEGEQGLMKSTALRVLGGDWFLDDLRKFGGRECSMQLSGRWIIELAELSGMTETTVEACKAFLGQTMDSYRPPYGRQVVEMPRQCIFAASTNKESFLRDETGDRRYWPVTCQWIDLAALERDRDQLWAEALKRFNDGQVWWMETVELRALAQKEQSDRFTLDPWEPEIAVWVQSKVEITPEDVLKKCFEYTSREITKTHRNRVTAIFRRLKLNRIQLRSGKDRGRIVWRHKIPE